MKIKKLLLTGPTLIAILGANAQSTVNNFPASGNVSLGGGNYLNNNRMYYQGYTVTANSYNRGTVASNLYWDNTLPGWTTMATGANDFSVLKFENGGELGFYTKPNETSLTPPLTYTDITPYKR